MEQDKKQISIFLFNKAGFLIVKDDDFYSKDMSFIDICSEITTKRIMLHKQNESTEVQGFVIIGGEYGQAFLYNYEEI